MANITYNSYGSLAIRHDGWNDLTDEAWSVWDHTDWLAYEYVMGETDYSVAFPVSNVTSICLRGMFNLAIHYRVIGNIVLVLLGSSIVSYMMGHSGSMKLRIARYDDRLTFVPKRGRRISGTPPPTKISMRVLWGGGFLVCTGRSATLRATAACLAFRVRFASHNLFVSRELK
jgi:hypothetical protein